jgi:hypothetical protein
VRPCIKTGRALARRARLRSARAGRLHDRGGHESDDVVQRLHVAVYVLGAAYPRWYSVPGTHRSDARSRPRQLPPESRLRRIPAGHALQASGRRSSASAWKAVSNCTDVDVKNALSPWRCGQGGRTQLRAAILQPNPPVPGRGARAYSASRRPSLTRRCRSSDLNGLVTPTTLDWMQAPVKPRFARVPAKLRGCNHLQHHANTHCRLLHGVLSTTFKVPSRPSQQHTRPGAGRAASSNFRSRRPIALLIQHRCRFALGPAR